MASQLHNQHIHAMVAQVAMVAHDRCFDLLLINAHAHTHDFFQPDNWVRQHAQFCLELEVIQQTQLPALTIFMTRSTMPSSQLAYPSTVAWPETSISSNSWKAEQIEKKNRWKEPTKSARILGQKEKKKQKNKPVVRAAKLLTTHGLLCQALLPCSVAWHAIRWNQQCAVKSIKFLHLFPLSPQRFHGSAWLEDAADTLHQGEGPQ